MSTGIFIVYISFFSVWSWHPQFLRWLGARQNNLLQIHNHISFIHRAMMLLLMRRMFGDDDEAKEKKDKAEQTLLLRIEFLRFFFFCFGFCMRQWEKFKWKEKNYTQHLIVWMQSISVGRISNTKNTHIRVTGRRIEINKWMNRMVELSWLNPLLHLSFLVY